MWPLEALTIIENSGLEPEYMDLVPLTETMFVANAKVNPGVQISLKLPKNLSGSVWLAPIGTKEFQAGTNMTQADLETGTIYAPTTVGSYKLYVLDDQSNIIMESKGTLLVTNSRL